MVSFVYPLNVCEYGNAGFGIMTNVWFFQTNRHYYDIESALRDKEYLQGNWGWPVSRYKKEIKKNDVALLWKSNVDANFRGIYAILKILSNPKGMEDNFENYWVKKENARAFKTWVECQIHKRLTPPLLIPKLKNMTLINLSIIKNPCGTNFLVSPDEWEIISKAIETGH